MFISCLPVEGKHRMYDALLVRGLPSMHTFYRTYQTGASFNAVLVDRLLQLQESAASENVVLSIYSDLISVDSHFEAQAFQM